MVKNFEIFISLFKVLAGFVKRLIFLFKRIFFEVFILSDLVVRKGKTEVEIDVAK